jgi:hypothetical protein
MRNILPSVIILSLAIAGQATVLLQPSTVQRSVMGNHELTLMIDSADDVLGIQFDLKYNPEELTFNGAASLLNDFMFECKDKGNGNVRGLLFSMSGEVINPDGIAQLIAFDFTPVSGFTGESSVEFAELILVGLYGTKITANTNSFSILSGSLIPERTSLQESYPNPFNPVTTINYDLSDEGSIQIMVYDALGRMVEQLVNKQQQAGSYEIQWDASGFSSGVYFVRMSAPNFTKTQKLLLVK